MFKQIVLRILSAETMDINKSNLSKFSANFQLISNQKSGYTMCLVLFLQQKNLPVFSILSISVMNVHVSYNDKKFDCEKLILEKLVQVIHPNLKDLQGY